MWWYVSTPRLTGAVRTEQDRIVETPPVWRRYHGWTVWQMMKHLRDNGVPVEIEVLRPPGGP